MIYVQEGHKKDMWFVCQKPDTSGITEIVKVFYSKDKADSYVNEHKKIRDRLWEDYIQIPLEVIA